MSYKIATKEELRAISNELFAPVREEIADINHQLNAIIGRIDIVERSQSKINARLDAMQARNKGGEDRIMKAVANLENRK